MKRDSVILILLLLFIGSSFAIGNGWMMTPLNGGIAVENYTLGIGTPVIIPALLHNASRITVKALTLESDNLMAFMYINKTGYYAGYYKCLNSNCSIGKKVQFANSILNGGNVNDLIMTANNKPLVFAMENSGTFNAIVYYCSDLNCTTVTRYYPSGITATTSGYGLESGKMIKGSDNAIYLMMQYSLNSGEDRNVLFRCTTYNCSIGVNSATLDSGGVNGGGFDGVIMNDSYFFFGRNYLATSDIKSSKCTNQACSSRQDLTIDTAAVGNVRVAKDANNLPVMAYSEAGKLKIAKCFNLNCSSFHMFASTGLPGAGVLRVGNDGKLLYAYQNATDRYLYLAKLTDFYGSSYNTVRISNLNITSTWDFELDSNNYPNFIYQTSVGVYFQKCNTYDCQSTIPFFISNLGNVGLDTMVPLASFSFNGGILYNGIPMQYRLVQSARNNTRTIYENLSDRGSSVLVTIGSDGLPVILDRAGTLPAMVITKCFNADCSQRKATIFKGTTEIGRAMSMTINTDGFPIIQYVNNTRVMVLRCLNLDCSQSTKTDLGAINIPNAGLQAPNSMVINSNGFPFFSYVNATQGSLRAFACSSSNCSSFTTKVIDSSTVYGLFPYTVLGTTGYPVILFSKSVSPYTLKLHFCNTYNCSTGFNRTLGAGFALNVAGKAMVISQDGTPLVVYSNGTSLQSYKCVDSNCSSGTRYTLGTVSSNTYLSVTLGSNNLPIIAYGNTSLKLNTVVCTDISCSSGFHRSTGQSIPIGSTPVSITLGSNGLPLIAFQGTPATTALTLLACGSENCVPYWGRR